MFLAATFPILVGSGFVMAWFTVQVLLWVGGWIFITIMTAIDALGPAIFFVPVPVECFPSGSRYNCTKGVYNSQVNSAAVGINLGLKACYVGLHCR